MCRFRLQIHEARSETGPGVLIATRIGIELSPAAIRIVEVEPEARETGRRRVRSFADLPASGPETHAALVALCRRDAAVVVWGAPSVHRQAVVENGPYDAMRAQALGSLEKAGIDTRGMLADIAPANDGTLRARHELDRKGVPTRRTVVVALADEQAVNALLQPVLDAGIRVRSVATPSVALGAIAQLRQEFSSPGAIEAQVALDARSTCISVVRDGALMASRELLWGFQDASRTRRAPEEVAEQLAREVREFVASIDAPADAFRNVCLCGGMPDLRASATLIAAHLGVNVDTLDTLYGIDEARLPEPAEEFRRHVAAVRLAWAAAITGPPAINLVRRRARASMRRLARIVVAGGIAAGFTIGWRIDQTDWWRGIAGRIWPGSESVARTVSPRVGSTAAAAQRELPPFEAVLGTILYSDDRPIAIVDGRVVTVGDRIRDAKVLQITPNTVVVQDAAGRRRQLSRP